MEERKKVEIEYYDKKAEKWLNKEKIKKKEIADFKGFNPLLLDSFRFGYQWLKENCQNKIVLDYGCGNGVHSAFPIKAGAEKVIGIDLSEKSLAIAKEKAKKEGLGDKIEIHFFHLVSWLAFPFLNLPGGKLLLKLLEFIDKILLKLPFLRKYAFKVVSVFSQPKNDQKVI